MPLKPALRSLLLLTAAASQAQASPPSPAVPSLSGRWLVTADMHGISVYVPMELLQQQGKISGTYDGQPLHGELKGGSLSFVAEDDTGGETVAATWAKGVLSMLGCIATAPAPARAAPNTGDSGPNGGNMDFNEIVEGATVYLPVSVPGALLYLGDGHAVQGDGEINGNALETSLDVEFTVDVIPGRRTPAPRVESATHIMAMGLGGSLDDAFRNATSNMAQWLAESYKLSPGEIAEVIGPAAEYKVSEVADRNAGIVLKISKEVLRTMH